MNKKDFNQYLMDNAAGYKTFMTKSIEYQDEKNSRRQPAKRWNETKVERAADRMWNEFADNIYEKVNKNIRGNGNSTTEQWLKFIEQNDLLEELSESISEMEFE